jgi:hypothetical protein
MSPLLHALNVASAHLANSDPLPPVTPDSNGMPGAQAIAKLMSWAKELSIIACGLGLFGSGAAIGIGHVIKNPHLAERGKAGLIASICGAVIVGSAIKLVNAAYGMA